MHTGGSSDQIAGAGFDDRFGTRLTPLQAWLAAAAGLAALAALLGLELALPVAFAGGGLAAAMVAIALVDRRSFLIPDWLSLPAIPLGILAAGSAVNPLAENLVPPSHLAGAAAGALSLYIVAVAYRRLRGREGLGLGDVKLAAAAGAWVGLGSLPDVLLVACTGAVAAVSLSVLRRGDQAIARTTVLPFGAFLAPAIWIVWAWQQLVL